MQYWLKLNILSLNSINSTELLYDSYRVDHIIYYFSIYDTLYAIIFWNNCNKTKKKKKDINIIDTEYFRHKYIEDRVYYFFTYNTLYAIIF